MNMKGGTGIFTAEIAYLGNRDIIRKTLLLQRLFSARNSAK